VVHWQPDVKAFRVVHGGRKELKYGKLVMDLHMTRVHDYVHIQDDAFVACADVPRSHVERPGRWMSSEQAT
jgi:hypothetical protein